MNPSPHHKHDHQRCISAALELAERLCRERGVRLTPLRRRVLEQIWQSHEAVKAYELIHRMSSQSHTVKPPTVYRALEFLLEQGFVHRIESLNGYIGCTQPQAHHNSQLLICRVCGLVSELEDPGIGDTLRRQAGRNGFAVEEQMVELRGLCASCRGSSRDHAH